MRAEVKVANIKKYENINGVITQERLTFHAVYNKQYDSTGLAEGMFNTFELYIPSAEFTINVVNPALFGKFKLDQKYYVDFTEAE